MKRNKNDRLRVIDAFAYMLYVAERDELPKTKWPKLTLTISSRKVVAAMQGAEVLGGAREAERHQND